MREAYATALAEHEMARRHKAFVHLAETGLAHMASIALSDYRTGRWNDPDVTVESALGRMRRPSLGHYLELIRAGIKATKPALLDFKANEMDESLPNCGRLASAIEGIEEAIDLEARNITRVVNRRLERPPPELEWLAAWDRVVAYRNRSEGHATAARWPIDHEDYFGLMTPILESAVVELLTTVHMNRIVDEHPVATLREIRYDGSAYQHVFDVDDAGVPVRTEVTIDRSLTDLYASAQWSASIDGKFLLTRTPSGGFEFYSLFWDLLTQGTPEPLAGHTGEIRPSIRAASPPSPSAWMVGAGSAPGTCGELVQGVLSDGRRFHVTCPVHKTATVNLRLRQSTDWDIRGLDTGHGKLARAIELTSSELDLGPLTVQAEHWTDLDVGKGMGSSTADIVAAARAVATAASAELTDDRLASIATRIESSDGSMYDGIVAFQQREGELVRRFAWWPQMAIVMLIPPNSFNTESANFQGKEQFAHEFDEILEALDQATEERNGRPFAEAATRSARLNQRFVPNPWFEVLLAESDRLQADGVNIGHTGTVTGLLFLMEDDSTQPLANASRALMQLEKLVPSSVRLELTTTPPSPDLNLR